MSFEYLIDTDRSIRYLKGVFEARTLLARLRPDGLTISAMTYAEVLEGVLFGRQRDYAQSQWNLFLAGVTVLALDEPIASRFASIRGGLRAAGNIIPDADIWIAATAIEHDLTLVTGNRRHFDRVPGLRILE